MSAVEVNGGICGKYGVGRMNEEGRDLIDFCEEHRLTYVKSFMKCIVP